MEITLRFLVCISSGMLAVYILEVSRVPAVENRFP